MHKDHSTLPVLSGYVFALILFLLSKTARTLSTPGCGGDAYLANVIRESIMKACFLRTAIGILLSIGNALASLYEGACLRHSGFLAYIMLPNFPCIGMPEQMSSDFLNFLSGAFILGQTIILISVRFCTPITPCYLTEFILIILER